MYKEYNVEGGIVKRENFMIGQMPVSLYGEHADKLCLFVHGLCGSAEDGLRFAKIAEARGWQVLAVNLPEHGGRADGVRLLPWTAVPELQAVLEFATARWTRVAVRATSIGAWLSLHAFIGAQLAFCMFNSPLLDMESMICGMMAQAGVTEPQLMAAGEIPTPSGQTLSWDYLCWVRQHPVKPICKNIRILYASGDKVIPRATVDNFVEAGACSLTIMDGGEHWFHTPEQLAILSAWEACSFSMLEGKKN